MHSGPLVCPLARSLPAHASTRAAPQSAGFLGWIYPGCPARVCARFRSYLRLHFSAPEHRLVLGGWACLFWLACPVWASGGCTDAADPQNVLQGGNLTIFDNTRMAFDQPSPPIEANPAYLTRWMEGDLGYEQDRVASPSDAPDTGGLGPLYVGKSCATCHQGAGRTKSTLFTHGGSGHGFSTFLAFLRSKNGQYFRDYGRVLHDQAIFGVQPEGKLRVEYSETCYTFPTPEQERYCLLRPKYQITDWYAEAIPDEDLVLSVRTPLRHVGLGLMLAVDKEMLKTLAQQDYPEYGISGKLQWVFERGQWVIGLSGHKAQHADLTVELGFLSDMGVTSHRFPDEIAEGQPQVTEDWGIEVSSSHMANVDMYMHGAGVPARRNLDDPQVQRGGQMFFQAKCHLCHTPTLRTEPRGPQLIDGTRLPMLANQTIHPYSDYLLHDMGPDLGDDFSQFQASGDEWRTAPLWGIGLQKIVNGHTHFLHDGRARNLKEAILWHRQEEGSVSYEIFRQMSQEDRDALIAFLNSL